MQEPEAVEIDFDVLLFEGETEHPVIPKLESGSQLDGLAIKREDGEGLESDGEDGKDVMPNLRTRQHAIDCIEEWTLENLIEMSSDKPSWIVLVVQHFQSSPTRETRYQYRKTTLALAEKGVQHHENDGYIGVLLKRDPSPQGGRNVTSSLEGQRSNNQTLVDDLAATWGLRRADLNIRAALKGIFFSSCLTLYLSHGEIIRGLDHEGTLIPVGEDIIRIEVDEKCQWILVIEKEAVFQTLVRLSFATKHEDIGPGIIITGKGYPDLATRQLVAALSVQLPEHVPLLALVDGDPHGLEIFLTYQLGSKSMAHENDQLVAPRLEWIGVTMEDIEELGIDSSKMIELSLKDRRKATSMLDNPDLPEELAFQLEQMLDTGLKAEIEVVSATRASDPHTLGGSRALDQYVHDKLATVLERVKGGHEDIIKLEASPPPCLSGAVSPTASPKLESQGSPIGSQQFYLDASRHTEESLDVEYLDFDDGV
ncbi:endodeoxyribonuclease [Ceratobasidium sp. 414]|nr:endodeoxyribonuclease [Ceratobasidium sp. 414]